MSRKQIILYFRSYPHKSYIPMFQSIFLWFTAPESYLGVIERELSLFGVQYRQLHAAGLAGAGVRLSNSL